MTDTDITDRVEVRAEDGSRLTFTRDERGTVSLSVGQCPDRSVSVRLPGAEWERVRAWGGGGEAERERIVRLSRDVQRHMFEHGATEDVLKGWQAFAGWIRFGCRVEPDVRGAAAPAGPGDTVPRAPVQALLAVLGDVASRIPYEDPAWQRIADARDEVRRHLDGGA